MEHYWLVIIVCAVFNRKWTLVRSHLPSGPAVHYIYLLIRQWSAQQVTWHPNVVLYNGSQFGVKFSRPELQTGSGPAFIHTSGRVICPTYVFVATFVEYFARMCSRHNNDDQTAASCIFLATKAVSKVQANWSSFWWNISIKNTQHHLTQK